MESCKLGLDLGFSNMKMTSIIGGQLVSKSIRSLADTKGFDNENMVNIDGNEVYFGVGSSLSPSDKTKRRYVRESLLLAVYKMFGSQQDTVNLELAVGLPLDLYKSKRKEEYKAELQELLKGTINGFVAGKPISVVVTRLKICAEGYSAFVALKGELEGNECVVLDIGHGTTDMVYMVRENGKWMVERFDTVPSGFGDIYKAVLDKHLNSGGSPLDLETVEKRIVRDLDIKNNNGMVKMRDYLTVAQPIVKSILDRVSNQFDDFDSIECWVVGSGSHLLAPYIDLEKVKVFEGNKAMYSNSVGYYCQL